MKKNILVISTSLRKNGNSEVLADEFIRGAKESGHTVTKAALYDKDIKFCRGCFACQKTKKCVLKDDINETVKQMLYADIIAFATPVYFYEMCGQMKTLLDRTNPLFPADYAFRDIYLLAAAGEEENEAIEGTVNGLQGWIDCFKKAKLAGVVNGLKLTDIGDAKKDSDILTTAYEMGKNA